MSADTTTDRLNWLNGLTQNACLEEMMRCCGASKWARALTEKRPFASSAALFAAADEVFTLLDGNDWLDAFSHHPKIGDLENLQKKFASTSGWASREQSGVEAADQQTLEKLAQGNAEYESKFGYIFIVCATGKSAREMLEILEKRLANDAKAELPVAAAEQKKITRLRLEKLLT